MCESRGDDAPEPPARGNLLGIALEEGVDDAELHRGLSQTRVSSWHGRCARDNLGDALGVEQGAFPALGGFQQPQLRFHLPGAGTLRAEHTPSSAGFARQELGTLLVRAGGSGRRRRTVLKGAGRELELPLLPEHPQRKLQGISRRADPLGHRVLSP